MRQTRARRPWTLLTALLIGTLFAAWRPAQALPSSNGARPVATAFTVTLSSVTAGAVDGQALDAIPPRASQLVATWPVHARHWSWHRGVSRRNGRDAEICLHTIDLPGSIPARPPFVGREECGAHLGHGEAVSRVLGDAASPRAPPARA